MISRDYIIALVLGLILIVAVAVALDGTIGSAEDEISNEKKSIDEKTDCIFENLETADECKTSNSLKDLRLYAT